MDGFKSWPYSSAGGILKAFVMKNVIGFTSVYYTLWLVHEPTERYNASRGLIETVQQCEYLQNLSIDYDKAVEKMKAKNIEFSIDLDLRGHYSFQRVLSVDNYEIWQFSFGKLAGYDMRVSDDVWQLNRAMKEEKSARRRVVARKRLLELSELIRNNDRSLSEEVYINACMYRYLTQKKVERENSKHYFKEGERVNISVTKTGSTYYDTQWGTVFVIWYQDSEGRIFKYKGSNPPNISQQDYVNISATVKHGMYDSVPETLLQRIKVNKAVSS